MSALVRAQPGASASVTVTSVRVEVPSLITWIVQETLSPFLITCSSGVFTTEMCGLITSGFSFSSPQAVVEPLLLSSPL